MKKLQPTVALMSVAVTAVGVFSSANGKAQSPPTATTSHVPAGRAALYARAAGSGRPMIVLHGGPDFDQSYLLPDLDRLADGFRLIYYDQRGRGKSADGVRPQDVSLASELDDIDRVRQYFHLRRPTLLGHSWGTVLALEYALRHPDRVSQLVLMNPAPASAADAALLRKAYVEQLGADMDRQRAVIAGSAYQQGDPEAVAARYRIHFRFALAGVGDYERLMGRMKEAFVDQGKDGIVKARAVENRLMQDTWERPEYDLLPRLKQLRVPTLVIAGDRDFIPAAIAEHIAAAIPGATLASLRQCGHFAFLECPDDMRDVLNRFFRRR